MYYSLEVHVCARIWYMGPMGDWPWYGGNFGTIVPNFPKEKALSSKPKTFSHKYTYGVAVVPKMYLSIFRRFALPNTPAATLRHRSYQRFLAGRRNRSRLTRRRRTGVR